jgi:2-keto-3-deoxy-L-rhamnonate aldolase RhmA
MISFKERLKNGERLIGPMVTLNSPEAIEVLTMVGFDWLFIDAEHGAFSTLDMQRLIQAAGAAMPCLIRVAVGQEVAIKKALDIGAAGIIVPQVNRVDQTEEIIRWARYAPQGNRGVGLARAHGYGLRFQDYIDRANDEVMVVIQAEHIDSVTNIEAIVRVPGVDAVLIGPYDLSASMGLMGQVDHPEVIAAIDRVTIACRTASKPLGIFGLSAEAVKPYIDQGYTLITAGVDTLLMAQAAKTLLTALQ